MKSELENLPNKVLYRILVKYMEEMYSQRLDTFDKDGGWDVMSKILKKHGIPNDFYDLNFMWATLMLNSQKLAHEEKYSFELLKPELKSWTIVAKMTGRAYYNEYSALEIESYTEPTNRELYDGDYNYSPYDGHFYDYDVYDSETTDWEIEDVQENTPKIKKNNNFQNESYKTKTLRNIEELNLYELVDLKEEIEKQIKSRLIILD